MKILFYLRELNIGGAETFIYNVLSEIDINQIKIDIAVQNKKNENKKLLQLCKEKRSKLMVITPFEKNYFRSIRELKNILENEQYDIIHFHANSLINMIPVICALKEGVKLVVHSHNSNNNLGGFLGKSLHYLNRYIISKINIVRVACSPEAGKWMFGKKEFKILSNAINLNDYQFSRSSRKEIWGKYGIPENHIVIGHIGRLVPAKNHKFLIHCFEKIESINNKCTLMIVGDGELMEPIKKLVEEKQLKSKVIFVGAVQNSIKYYSAFDVMLFPSIFEGLPFTLVEAQASGLPVVTSENVTRDLDVTGLIEYISLEKSLEFWCERVLKAANTKNNRKMYKEKMMNSIFDINYMINKLKKIYS